MQRRSLNRGLFLALVLSDNSHSQAVQIIDANRFPELVQPIFDEHCVICHMTGAENGGLALESGRSLAGLVGVPSTESSLQRVSPGDPASSYLMKKLLGVELAVGGQGEQMPLGMRPLPAEDISTIEAWIRSLSKK